MIWTVCLLALGLGGRLGGGFGGWLLGHGCRVLLRQLPPVAQWCEPEREHGCHESRIISVANSSTGVSNFICPVEQPAKPLCHVVDEGVDTCGVGKVGMGQHPEPVVSIRRIEIELYERGIVPAYI